MLRTTSSLILRPNFFSASTFLRPISVVIDRNPESSSISLGDRRRRSYCSEREPRVYNHHPVPLHRRIEPPNPQFEERHTKPKPLESLFDDDERRSDETDESIEDERDLLYSSIEIETRGHDTAVLKSYERFALSAAKHLEIRVSNVYVPKEAYIWWMRTLLRSVHIFKKRRFQYETRTYYRRFTVARLTGSTADTFLEYIQRNLPEGVGMRVTRRLLIERPDYLKQPPKGAMEREAEVKKEEQEKRSVGVES